MAQFQVGQKIITPSKRFGEVVTPEGGDLLPLHCLIRFPSGDRCWVLASILRLQEAETSGADGS